MRPNQLLLALRPRSHWEALDQGMVMARYWFWPLIKTWLVFTLPALLLLGLLLRDPLWVTLIFWWLLPLWERPILFMLSRLAFDEKCKTSEVWQAMREISWLEIIYALTIFRFNLARSMDAPVAMLEQPDRKTHRQRVFQLHRTGAVNAAHWLTIVSAHIAGVLTYLMIFMPQLLDPAIMSFNWEEALQKVMEEGQGWQETFQVIYYYLALAIITPFYVASGFSLYLNRRMDLEGWDIEIAFRHLRSSWKLPTQVLLTLLLPALILLGSNDIYASALPLDRYTVAEEIDAIESSEPVHSVVNFKYPVALKQWFTSEPDLEKDHSWYYWLVEVFFPYFRWLALGVFLSFVAIVLWRYRHKIGKWIRGVVIPMASSTILEKTTINAENHVSTKPVWAGVDQEALSLLQQGQQREALALLYRGALSKLYEHLDTVLPPGCSEYECLLFANQHLSMEDREYFRQLIQSWLAVAYGGAELDVAMIAALCHSWQQHIVHPEVVADVA